MGHPRLSSPSGCNGIVESRIKGFIGSARDGRAHGFGGSLPGAGFEHCDNGREQGRPQDIAHVHDAPQRHREYGEFRTAFPPEANIWRAITATGAKQTIERNLANPNQE